MVFNHSKLRGRIRELGMTEADVAQRIGITGTSFSKKMSGKNKFVQTEIKKMIDLLDIPVEEVSTYFFVTEVHKI